MHNWGQEGVDWAGISDAAEYIASSLRKWRVNVTDHKEKFGTVRVYLFWGWSSLHCITHPGYHYCQYPKDGWLYKLNYSSVVYYFLRRVVNPILIPLQQRLYTYVYGQAIKKWPHLRHEILEGADYSELLGKHGVHRIPKGKDYYQIHVEWREGDPERKLDTEEF